MVLSACGMTSGSKAPQSNVEGKTVAKEMKEDDEMERQEISLVLGEKQSEGRLYTDSFEDFIPYTEVIDEFLTVPRGYELKEVQTDIRQNDQEVLRLRYGREGQEAPLFGEHYSVVIAEDLTILGFITITQELVIEDESELPSSEEAVEQTELFLETIAPNYFKELSNLWIDRHDEPLMIEGKEQLVSGTKYKAYVPRDDNYAWVIIDKNGQVMSFERGIQWVNSRTTEKWLYDEYLYDGSLDLFQVRKK